MGLIGIPLIPSAAPDQSAKEIVRKPLKTNEYKNWTQRTHYRQYKTNKMSSLVLGERPMKKISDRIIIILYSHIINQSFLLLCNCHCLLSVLSEGFDPQPWWYQWHCLLWEENIPQPRHHQHHCLPTDGQKGMSHDSYENAFEFQTLLLSILVHFQTMSFKKRFKNIQWRGLSDVQWQPVPKPRCSHRKSSVPSELHTHPLHIQEKLDLRTGRGSAIVKAERGRVRRDHLKI